MWPDPSTIAGLFLLVVFVAKFLPDAGTAQAAALEQLAAFTAQFPAIVAQLGLGKRK